MLSAKNWLGGGYMKAITAELLHSFTPKQICWICLLLTLTFGSIGSTYAIRAFASTDSVKEVRNQINRVEVRLLEREIFDRQSEVCRAVKNGQPARAYREQLQSALRAYEDLTGRPFSLPDCEELG
jgi:hypothetical protein